MRFASREKAVLAQFEVGGGVVPGGGASEWVPALVGRSRALEIIIGANDFDAATAVRYGWMNRSTPDANSTASWMIWHRIASYETRTIELTKKTIRRREVGPERGRVAHYLSPVTLRRGECWHARCAPIANDRSVLGRHGRNKWIDLFDYLVCA